MTNLRRCAAAGLVTLAAASGCYAYLPVEGQAPPLGRVRVTLTQEGSRHLTPLLGPGVTVAEGHVGNVMDDGAIQLAVDWVQYWNGMRTPWTGEGTVRIAAEHRQRIERHTYMRRRSIAAAATLVAALVTTAVVAITAVSGGTDGVGPPPPPPALVPRR